MHRGNTAVTGRRDSSQGTDGRRRDGLRGRSPASTPRLVLLLYPRDLSSCSPCPQRIHVSHLRSSPMLILFSPGGQAVFPPLTHPQRVSSQSEESARRPSPLGVQPRSVLSMLDTSGFGGATPSPSGSLCAHTLRSNVVKGRHRERGGNGLRRGLASPAHGSPPSPQALRPTGTLVHHQRKRQQVFGNLFAMSPL